MARASGNVPDSLSTAEFSALVGGMSYEVFSLSAMLQEEQAAATSYAVHWSMAMSQIPSSQQNSAGSSTLMGSVSHEAL